jgi:hypothetical protein
MIHLGMKVSNGHSEGATMSKIKERKCKSCGKEIDRPIPKRGPDHAYCSECLHSGSPTQDSLCSECGFEMDKPVPLRGFVPRKPLCERCTSMLNAARIREMLRLRGHEDKARENSVSTALLVDSDGVIQGDLRTDNLDYARRLHNTGEPKHEPFIYEGCEL